MQLRGVEAETSQGPGISQATASVQVAEQSGQAVEIWLAAETGQVEVRPASEPGAAKQKTRARTRALVERRSSSSGCWDAVLV